MAERKMSAEIRLAKVGPNGNPYAEILVDKTFNVAELGAVIQRVTRDKNLLEKFGLRACGACKSGFDINIRDRFEQVMHVELHE